MVSRRLGTIAAILGATPGLDRNQRGQLYGIGVVMLAMNHLGAVKQVVERQIQ
jgi:hypothetical protein